MWPHKHRMYNDPVQMTGSAEQDIQQTAGLQGPPKGPFARWPGPADAVLAVLCFLITITMWYGLEGWRAAPSGAWALFVAGSIALVWRRSHPELVHAVVVAASALSFGLGYSDGALFALLVSLYSLGRYSDNEVYSHGGVAAGVILLIGIQLFDNDADPLSMVLFVAMLGFIDWYIGRRLRARGEYVQFLRERAEYLEEKRHTEMQQAVTDERARIARELHDIVAHQVSLMIVQAGAAKTVANTDMDAAIAAMGAVEKAGRAALNEVRHLLGVLRPDGASKELSPQPGLAEIPILVRDLENTGLDISLELSDASSNIPSRIGLAVYRVVQESLTNALKHADTGTSVAVGIDANDRFINVSINNDGRSVNPASAQGHGLIGMRERVHQLGGSFSAVPGSDGGFVVECQIPLNGESE